MEYKEKKNGMYYVIVNYIYFLIFLLKYYFQSLNSINYFFIIYIMIFHLIFTFFSFLYDLILEEKNRSFLSVFHNFNLIFFIYLR